MIKIEDMLYEDKKLHNRKFAYLDFVVKENHKRYVVRKIQKLSKKHVEFMVKSHDELLDKKKYLFERQKSAPDKNDSKKVAAHNELAADIAKMQVEQIIGVKVGLASSHEEFNEKIRATNEEIRKKIIKLDWVRKIKNICLNKHISENKIKKILKGVINFSEEVPKLLLEAPFDCRVDILATLIRHKDYVIFDANKIFWLACEDNRFCLVKYLLNYGVDINYVFSGFCIDKIKPIDAAFSWGNYEIANYLLDHGANINGLFESTYRNLAGSSLQWIKHFLRKGLHINAYRGALIVSACRMRRYGKSSNIKKVKALLKLGANVKENINGALKNAIESGDITIVDFLLTQGANLSSIERSIIGEGLQKNYLLFPILIEHKMQDYIKGNERPILQSVCKHGDLGALKLLSKNGFDIHPALGENKYSADYPLKWALYENKLKIAKYLMSSADSDAIYKDFLNSLFEEMCEKGYLKAVNFLIKYVFDKYVLDGGIKKACYAGRLNTVKLLIKKGVSYRLERTPISAPADSPLAKACAGHRFSVARYLLKKGVDINEGEGHALHAMCLDKNFKAVDFLVKYGADVDIRGGVLSDIFTEKVKLGIYFRNFSDPRERRIELEKYIPDKDKQRYHGRFADLDFLVNDHNKRYTIKKANNKNLKRWAALESEIMAAKINLMITLSEALINPSLKENDKLITEMQLDRVLNVKGPAAYLCALPDSSLTPKECHKNRISKRWIKQVKNMYISKKLSENEVKVVFKKVNNISDEIPKLIANAPFDIRVDITCILIEMRNNSQIMDIAAMLCIACREGNFSLVKYLIKHGADVNCGIDKPGIPLNHACSSKSYGRIAKYLLKKGADINFLRKETYTNLGYSPLRFIQYLVTQGLDIHAYNDEIIFGAADSGNLFKVKELLKMGAKLSSSHAQEALSSVMRSSLKHVNAPLMKLLIAHGADLNKVDRAIVKQALIANYLSVSPILAGCHVNISQEEIKECIGVVLSRACSDNNLRLLKILSKKGIDIHGDVEKNMYRYYPLKTAFTDARFEIAEYLITDAPVRYKQEKVGMDLFRSLVQDKKVRAIQFLLKQGFNSKEMTSEGLYWACYKGHLPAIKLLIKNGVSYRLKDMPTLHYTQSFLGVACAEHQFVAAEYLLELGVDINEGEGHALRKMCSAGNLEAVEFLIRHGADINVMDNIILKTAYKEKDQALINVLTASSKGNIK